LRRSPLLWHEDLKNILKELGLYPISKDPCLYSNDKLILMVFVDNMILIYHLKNKLIAINFKNKLKNKYELKEIGEANQFLGIKIIRDRPNKTLWICQDNYIKKITYKFNLMSIKSPKTPLPSENLIINNKY
jgi:hypothetical protein